MANITKVDTKLAAIAGKDTGAITATSTPIPFLSPGYTKSQLEDWLAICATELNDIKTNNYTNSQIDDEITAIYDTLGAFDKTIADALIAGGYDPPLTDATSVLAYNKLRQIALLLFSKE